MTEPVRLEIDIEVRYAETDQMGVVHHSNYIVWFEQARTRLCAQTGFHYAEIEKMGYLLVVTGVEVTYRRPAHFGDTVRVACWGERLGSRGVRFAYEVHKGDERIATGATDHVWVDASSRWPCLPPKPIRDAFRKLGGLPEGS